MKKVIMANGRVIETPWLTADEAASYCGIGKNTFRDLVGKFDVPHSGPPSAKKYDTEDLDVMMVKWRNPEE